MGSLLKTGDPFLMTRRRMTSSRRVLTHLPPRLFMRKRWAENCSRRSGQSLTGVAICRKTSRLPDDTRCLELRFHARARDQIGRVEVEKMGCNGTYTHRSGVGVLETSQMSRNIDVSVRGYLKRQWQLWDVPLDWWSVVWLIFMSGVHNDVNAVSPPEYILLILHRAV